MFVLQVPFEVSERETKNLDLWWKWIAPGTTLLVLDRGATLTKLSDKDRGAL